MQKYVGRFRVKSVVDKNGKFSENTDDTYVECKNGIEMYRYSDDILALYIPSINTANRLRVELWDYFTEETKNKINYEVNLAGKLLGEWNFKFYEKYIDEVALVVQPKISGANINPKSMRNLRKNHVYLQKNPELIVEFKNRVKSILEERNHDFYMSRNIYKFIGERLELDIEKLAREKKIKMVEVLDEIGMLERGLELLDEWDE